MNDLAGFSEWTLALLPRLFLYPGGLWLLAVVLAFRFLSEDRHRPPLRSCPGALSSAFLRSDLLVLATAWVAVALLPIPGAAPLPFPTDRLAIAGLLAISLAFGGNSFTSGAQRTQRTQRLHLNYGLWLELAILTAVVAPVAGQRTLLDTNSTISGWISLLAVLVGMAAVAPQAVNSLPLAVRLVGWLGLAAAPLWTLPRLEDPLRVAIAYTILVLTTAVAGRLFLKRIKGDLNMVVVCTLALLSLLAALLVP